MDWLTAITVFLSVAMFSGALITVSRNITLGMTALATGIAGKDVSVKAE